MEDYFLRISKRYFTLCQNKYIKIDIIDVAILAQIEEFHRNKRECFFSNATFAQNFGISVATVKRKLDHLCNLGFIFRRTHYVPNQSQASKQRFLYMNEDAIQMAIKESENISPNSRKKQGSNLKEARIKQDESKVQSEPIKDNKKISKEDNINNTDHDLHMQNEISYDFHEYVEDTCSIQDNMTSSNTATSDHFDIDIENPLGIEVEYVTSSPSKADDSWMEDLYGELRWDDGPTYTSNDEWSTVGWLPNAEEIWASLDRIGR